MKVAFATLGCKLNYAETSTYERGFKAAGADVVSWREKADVYIVNTCTVTAMSDAKSRNLVRKVHRVNPEALIVVTGCSAELRRSDYEGLDGVGLVFGATEKSAVVPTTLSVLSSGGWGDCASASLHPSRTDVRVPPVHEAAGGHGTFTPATAGKTCTSVSLPSSLTGTQVPPVHEVTGGHGTFTPASAGKGSASDVFGAYSSGERTRSFLKVQDGCNNFCAYCTVPYARGRSRNIPISECVRMAREIAAGGVKEIVLTGVNTGDFGRTTGETFLELLQALNEVEGIERYRISSIEPNLITEEIVDWIATGTKFLPHFHIPLQTGSDTLLKAMGRHYDTAFFADRIAYIRSRMEGPGKLKVFFGIDTMVGLPGETEELFKQTYDFISSIRPAFIHIFPYSVRPGTRAAGMGGQLTQAVKDERVKVLEELCDRLHSEFVESNRGLAAKVLFESKEKDGLMSGYTENYIRISRPYDESLVGQLTDLVI